MYAQFTEAGLAKLRSAAPGHVNTVRTNVFDLLSPRDVQGIRRYPLSTITSSPPRTKNPEEINTFDDGRGVYFDDIH